MDSLSLFKLLLKRIEISKFPHTQFLYNFMCLLGYENLYLREPISVDFAVIKKKRIWSPKNVNFYNIFVFFDIF